MEDEPVDVTTESVLDALWREHSAGFWRAVFAYAGDADLANDAVAEAFAQCLARGEAVRSRSHPFYEQAPRSVGHESHFQATTPPIPT